MKKILLAVACFAMTLLAQANPTHKVKINDGLTVSVEACSGSIFRIKVSPRKDFTESLMERSSSSRPTGVRSRPTFPTREESGR